MTQGINDFILDINNLGIVGTGGPNGATLPRFESSLNGYQSGISGLRLNTRVVKAPHPVSANGNNTFTSPVTFGLDMGFIFVDHLAYTLGIDYSFKGNDIIWKNPNVTLTSSSNIVLFGPANEYTAKAFTVENIDLKNVLIFNNSHIQLSGNNQGPDYFPYGENSIYMFVNGKCMIPSVDFTYNPSTQKIDTSNFTIPLNVFSDKVFIFYYNLVPTTPFRLGESLVRQVFSGNANQAIGLIAASDPQLAHASNIFLERSRYNNKTDYVINNTTFNWEPDAAAAYVNTNNLDVSYFKDKASNVNFFTEFFLGSDFGNAVVQHQPSSPTKGMLYLNGLLSIAPLYDNVSSPGPSTKDYTISANVITWIGVPQMQLSYKAQWCGFADAQSGNFVNMLYFTDSTTPKQLVGLQDPSKVIYFLNGQARFTLDGGCTVANGFVSSAGLPTPPVGNTTAVQDQIAVLYFNNADYASLWKFVQLNLTTSWPENTSKTLPLPAKSLKSFLLFIQGIKQEPGIDYTLDPSGTILTNMHMGAILNTTSVILVYV